jgi:propanol-preferring alcohol dehydrogenase
MKAMVLDAFSEPLALRTLPVPAAGADEVLVRVRACGICGSDLKITSGKIRTTPTPHVPGHEIAGEIVAVGERVSPSRVRERVALHIYHSCGRCRWCRAGSYNLCIALKGRLGFELPGGFAHYTVAPSRNAVALPDSLTFEEAALIPCGLLAVYHAIGNAAIGEEDRVLMLGVGGLGIHGVQFLKLQGPHVTAVDVREGKLALAQAYGADRCLTYREFAASGEKYDVVFDSVGDAAVTAQALTRLDKAGRYVMVAYTPGTPSGFSSEQMHLDEIRIIGTRNGTLGELSAVAALLASRRIKAVIDRVLPLEKANEALQLVKSGETAGRVVLQV